MHTLKTLLVDDEFLALNLLEKFCQNIPELEIIDKVKSPMAALDILHRTQVDLLFLDIQMPTLSGNNLLKTLKQAPMVIFTTAYSEYALEAFELNAVDYLLKPFSFERFLQAVNKARDQHYLRSKEAPVAPVSPVAPPIASPEREFFSIKGDGKIVRLRLEDILFVEGLKEYVRFVCRDRKYVTLESLKNLEETLPKNQFLRVHKSFIVAKNKVQSLEGNLLQIGVHRIPISRSRKEAVVREIF